MVQELVSEREKSKVGERFASTEFNVGEAKLHVIVYPNGTLSSPGQLRIGIWNKSDEDVVLEKVNISVEDIYDFETELHTVEPHMIISWPWSLNAQEIHFENLKDGQLEVKTEVEIKGGLTILGESITTAPVI